jgi:hypothetical protein
VTYQQELDDARQEVRRGSSGPVVLWPKVAGLNVAVTGTPTWIAYDPAGTVIGNGNATADAVGSVSRLTATVDVSGETSVGENYRVAFTYTATASYTESVHFDVVVEPIGTIGVSMNDLMSEQSNAEEILTRQAAAQESGRTAQQEAAILAHRAWSEVRSWLKRKIQQQGASWPLFIVNREELRAVVAALAIHKMIVAQGMTSPDIREQADYWRGEAERRFAGLPELQFSTDTDAVADDAVRTFAVTEMRRTWGGFGGSDPRSTR